MYNKSTHTMKLCLFNVAIAGCLFCGSFTSSCSDDKAKAQPEEQKKTAFEKQDDSKITEQHAKIPNSNLYIIPPAGFTVDEASGTLGDADGTAHFMQMQIISGTTSEKLLSDFKSEADKNFPGSWKEDVVTVNGHKANIYSLKNVAYNQYILVFTDGYSDEMIIGNYEESEAAIGKEMFEALKTVIFKK